MKALTVRVPYAGLIINGIKDIENRDWTTKYRGRIAITSSAKKDLNECDIALKVYTQIRGRGLEGLPEFKMWNQCCNQTGVVLGTVELVDCVRKSDSPWFFGTYGWVLRNPRALKVPIPVLGKLGLWELPEDVARMVER